MNAPLSADEAQLVNDFEADIRATMNASSSSVQANGTVAGATSLGGITSDPMNSINFDPWQGQTIPQGITQAYTGAVGNWDNFGRGSIAPTSDHRG